jgi:DNA primase
VLVACGTSLMPRVELPAWVGSVVVAGDNNAPGRTAVKNTEEALTALGIATRATFPKAGFKDWNDQLRGIRS